MRSRLRIPFPTLMSVFWLYHVTEVFASECEQVAWTTSNCEVGLCDSGTGACSTKSGVGGTCSSADDCFAGKACLGGRCCSFTETDRVDNQYQLRAGCSACGDANAMDSSGDYPLPGKCLSCSAGHTYFYGDTSTDLACYDTYWQTVLAFTGRCLPDNFCSGELSTEYYLVHDEVTGGGSIYCYSRAAPGAGCTEDYQCQSGSCMGGYCCANGIVSSNCEVGLCDSGTGACSTKSGVGGTCSSADDCFAGKACLGGRCCSFTETDRVDNQYQLRAGCSACGDANAMDSSGDYPLPGKCLSCSAGHTYFYGDTSTDLACYDTYWQTVLAFTGRCLPDNFCSGDLSTEYYLVHDEVTGGGSIYCYSRAAPGAGCTEDYQCQSGSCMGGYCCANGIVSSNCEVGLCDSGTGACSTKSGVGGTCSSADDCFAGKACLGGRCCSFTETDRVDNQYQLRAGCSACGDANAMDSSGDYHLPASVCPAVLVTRTSMGTLQPT